MSGKRLSVVVDGSAPLWGTQLGTEINAALAQLGADDDAIRSQTTPTAQLPVGTVAQVVMASSVAGSSTASTSFVDVTGASVTITPTTATSSIIVLASSAAQVAAAGAGQNSVWQGRLMKGATVLQSRTVGVVSGAGMNAQSQGSGSFAVLDAPATTAPVTYKLQHATSNAAGAATTSDITLIAVEIK